MANLIKQATAQGLKDRVIWLDEYVSTEELMKVIKCTSVFLTTFDENTPTSVSLTATTPQTYQCLNPAQTKRQKYFTLIVSFLRLAVGTSEPLEAQTII